ERGDDSVGRDEQSPAGRSRGVQFSQARRSPSRASHGKQEAGSDVEFGIGSGERGSENDKIHEVGGGGNFGEAEDADEWAFGDAGVVPRHHANEDGDCAEVDPGEQKESEPRGAGNVFRGTRFAGGDG